MRLAAAWGLQPFAVVAMFTARPTTVLDWSPASPPVLPLPSLSITLLIFACIGPALNSLGPRLLARYGNKTSLVPYLSPFLGRRLRRTGRLLAYAHHFALHLGLDKYAYKELRQAVALADIALPRSDRRRPLTEAQWLRVKMHPLVAAAWLLRKSPTAGVAKLVRYHHERWDGAGYPAGLSGRDIPLGSRIMLLLETFDALVTGSRHRKPLPLMAACLELQRVAGSQLDPFLVSAFAKMAARHQHQLKDILADFNDETSLRCRRKKWETSYRQLLGRESRPRHLPEFIQGVQHLVHAAAAEGTVAAVTDELLAAVYAVTGLPCWLSLPVQGGGKLVVVDVVGQENFSPAAGNLSRRPVDDDSPRRLAFNERRPVNGIVEGAACIPEGEGQQTGYAFLPPGQWQVLAVPLLLGEQVFGVLETVLPELELVQGTSLKEAVFSLAEAGSLAFAAVAARSGQFWRDGDGQKQQLHNVAYLEELAADFTHEIRNPLAAIRGLGQWLQSEVPVAATSAQLIVSEVDRLQQLTEDFLKLLDAPWTQYKARNLNDIVKQVTALLRAHPARGRIEIVKELDSQMPPTLMIGDKILQVVFNIGLNAVEAILEEGIITVRTEYDREADMVFVSVIDTGVGIEPADKALIFGRFFTTKDEGTGLGLPLCQQIVESHGGNIEVQSEPGRGTQVTIGLPRAPSTSAPRLVPTPQHTPP